MADMRISDLSPAAVLHESDLLETSQPDENSASGYASVRITDLALATFILKSINFADLSTTAKNVIGAINEVMHIASIIPTFSVLVVQTLPTQDISETTIYLTPSQNPQTQDAYDEFIYVNNAWEHVGSTAVDLSAYYTKLEVDGLLATKANTADVSTALALKADKTGEYKTLGAGKAVMNTYDSLGTDTGIYSRRAVPGIADGAKKELQKKVVGATVCWNQMLDPNDFLGSAGTITTSGNKITFTATAKTIYQYFRVSLSIKKNHRYINTFDITNSESAQISVSYGEAIITSYNVEADTKTHIEFMTKASDNLSKFYIYPDRTDGLEIGGTSIVENAMLIDLTAMFGTAIADHVYTLERATEGSGIAWIKSYGFLQEDYYEPNDGTLESVRIAAHKTQGINWEEEYPYDKTKELRGIFNLVNGELTANGDTYESDGTVTRKYAVVDLGSLTYTRTGSGLFQTKVSGQKKVLKGNVAGNIVCYPYTAIDANSISGPQGTNPSPNLVMAVNSGTPATMYFNNTSYTDPADFKTAMSGVYLIYELSTPTTETAEPYNPIQEVEYGGTEKWIDAGVEAGERDVTIPCGQETEYFEETDTTEVVTLPAKPMIDGRYKFEMTISNGTPTLDWVIIQETSTESAGNGNRSLSLMKSAPIETKEEEPTEENGEEIQEEPKEETKNENTSESK